MKERKLKKESDVSGIMIQGGWGGAVVVPLPQV